MRKIGIGLAIAALIVLILMIAFMGYLVHFDEKLYATMTAVYRK